MRPVGAGIIAILTRFRALVYSFIGLVLLVVGHVSVRLVSAMASYCFFETLFSCVGKVLGFGALLIAVAYIAVGLGLWRLKNWARVVTIVLVRIWLFLVLIRILRFPTLARRARSDRRSIVYLMLPEMRRLFMPAQA